MSKTLGYYCSTVQVPAGIERLISDQPHQARLLIADSFLQSVIEGRFECGESFFEKLTDEQSDWLEGKPVSVHQSILKWIVNELI